jgi:hypothetical protein
MTVDLPGGLVWVAVFILSYSFGHFLGWLSEIGEGKMTQKEPGCKAIDPLTFATQKAQGQPARSVQVDSAGGSK